MTQGIVTRISPELQKRRKEMNTILNNVLGIKKPLSMNETDNIIANFNPSSIFINKTKKTGGNLKIELK